MTGRGVASLGAVSWRAAVGARASSGRGGRLAAVRAAIRRAVGARAPGFGLGAGLAVASGLGLGGCVLSPAPAASAASIASPGAAAPARSAPPETPRPPPLLRLAPALLGHPLALQQHITAHTPGGEHALDVLLEADAAHVALGVLAAGQLATRLSWDGVELVEQRAPWWPEAVSGARILSDLQLTLWPVPAVQAALPEGWQLVERGAVRTLTDHGMPVATVTRRGAARIEIDQPRDHYRLTIESRPIDASPAAPVAPAPP